MVIDLFENHKNKRLIYDDKPEKKIIGIVTFELDDEIIGIELQYILEIINISNITRLYKIPEYLVGITNLRGQIKPVIDLKKFLNIDNGYIAENAIQEKKGLLLSFENLDAIVMVDNINKVEWISEDDLREPPDTASDILKEFTTYLVCTKSKPIVVISGQKILTSDLWNQYREE